MRAKKFELFGGCLGNGTTVCNKAVMEYGDYKKVCHISNEGEITWYVSDDYCPPEAIAQIEQWANAYKERYNKWYSSLSPMEQYQIKLDNMSFSELVEYFRQQQLLRKKEEE